MASISRHPKSKYWSACFRLPNGKRTKRSTKQTDARKAQEIADLFERASGTITQQTQAKKVLSRITEIATGEPLKTVTAQDWLTQWSLAAQRDYAPRTGEAYTKTANDFLKSLGPKAAIDINYVTKNDVAVFRDQVKERTSPATANKALKYLRTAFSAAWRDGVIGENVADKLQVLKHYKFTVKPTFSKSQILTLLANCQGEWKGIVLFSLFTGQRLGDVVRLKWGNIDLENCEYCFISHKTQRTQIGALPRSVIQYFKRERGYQRADEQIFPNQFSKINAKGEVSSISKRFNRILVINGIIERRPAAAGEGRSGKRTISGLSHHSFRHTLTTLLKENGSSEGTAMAIIGHNSKAVSAGYTHISMESMKSDIDKVASSIEPSI